MIDGAAESRYDRVLLVVSPLLIVVQYALYRFLRASWAPPLTKDAVKVWCGPGAVTLDDRGRTRFTRDASHALAGGVLHSVFGTVAFFASQGYASLEPRPERLLGDSGVLLAAGDVEALRLQEIASFLGSVFGAVMVFYTFFWALRWDTDPTMLGHHLCFAGVTIVLARRSALPHSGLVAMAMEGSSPALNLMSIVRQIDEPNCQAAQYVCFGVFFVLFMALRVALFGSAVVRTVELRLLHAAAFPPHVPAWELDLVVMLWVAGWMLQLYWACSIIRKLARTLRKSAAAPAAPPVTYLPLPPASPRGKAAEEAEEAFASRSKRKSK